LDKVSFTYDKMSVNVRWGYFMNNSQSEVLLGHKIALIREQLDELIQKTSITSGTVLKLSHKLDKLIVRYYNLNSKRPVSYKTSQNPSRKITI
jgi:hypothetical protein